MAIQLPQKEEDIVTFLYRAILKRDPDPGGLSNYAEKLRKGELNIPQLVFILYTSDENKQKRKLFKESANLALWDFLNSIKDTVVYKELNELAMFKLYMKDSYSDVIYPYNFEPGSLVVTNRMITPRSDIDVYTTSSELRQLLKMNSINVVENLYEINKNYRSCYIVDPDMFDAIGVIVRKLDEICQFIYTNKMKSYIQSRVKRSMLVLTEKSK